MNIRAIVSNVAKAMNPWSTPEGFAEDRIEREKEIFRKLDEEVAENARSIGDTLDAFVTDWQYSSQIPFGELSRIDENIKVEQIFQNKQARIIFYREMSFYPPTSRALDIISDECIVKNNFGKYASLNLTPNFAEKITEAERRQLQVDFDYVMRTVFRAGGHGSLWQIFRKWLIEGEIFLEMIPSKKKNKLIGIRVMPAMFTFPIYREGVLIGFKEAVLSRQLKDNPVQHGGNTLYENALVESFNHDEVAYANFGEFGFSKQDVIGYLETGKRSYAQLKQTEDSMIIYRRNRAIERLIFGVDVGTQANWKSNQIVEKFKEKYNRIERYNPQEGVLENYKNHVTLTENYFIPTTGGQKTDVQSLSASGSFANQIDDMKMFMSLHYESLKIPKTRWGAESDVQYSNKHELALEEMNFEKLCSRFTSEENFGKIIYDVFIKHLQLRGYPDKYLDRSLYNIQLNRNNHFELYKKFELEQARAELMNSFAEKVLNTEHVKNGTEKDALFSKDFFLRKILCFSDEEILENDDLIKEEVNKIKMEAPKGGGDGGGDMGFGGGDDFTF